MNAIKLRTKIENYSIPIDENNIYRGNNPSWRFCRKCRTIRNREFENNRRIV